MSKVKKVLLTILAALIGVLLLFCAAFYVFFDVPDWQKLDISKLSALAQTSSMYDMNGELMSELRGSENRIIVSLDEIPLHTRQAFIAAEDLRFYDHPFSRTAFKIGSDMFSSLNVIMISGPHSRTFLVIGRPRRPDKNGEIVSGFPDPAGRLSHDRKDKRHREQEP